MLKERRIVLKPCLTSSWTAYGVSRKAVQQIAVFFFRLSLLGELCKLVLVMQMILSALEELRF